MTRTAFAFVLFALAADPAWAQGRGRNQTGIPPGHMPPPGECRVWYDGVPPGRQPAPTSCGEAERIARRDGRARVVYGGDRTGPSREDRWRDRDDRDRGRRGEEWERSDGRRPRGDNPRTGGRAVPRDDRDRGFPRGESRYGSAAYENGYRDGVTKGREDLRDGDRYDPSRHAWYRSGSRGYDGRHGTREQYRSEYRAGFAAGYEEAYRRVR
ncbi:MAG TPA: hypothetical protein VM364_06700 [Vicinamibacterales bacterium]|nr:hypothetical protein [Vicinamibacterales bacterium]